MNFGRCVIGCAALVGAMWIVSFRSAEEVHRLRDVEVAHDAPVAVVATESGLVLTLDLAGGAVRARTRLGVEIDAIGLDPTGGQVAVVTAGGDVIVFDPLDGATRRLCRTALQARASDRGHSGNLTVEFDPSGERILVAALGRGMTLLRSSGEILWRWPGPTDGPWGENDSRYGTRLSWDHEHDRIALATETGFEVIDAGSGEVITVERVPGEPPVPVRFASPADIFSVVFDGKRNTVYAGHCDCRLRAYDLSTGETAVLHTYARPMMGLPDDPYGQPPEPADEPRIYLWTQFAKLSLSPDGARLGYSTTENVNVGILDLESRSCRASFETYSGSMGVPGRIAWSDDSKRLFFTSPDSTAIRFVLPTSELAMPREPEPTKAIEPPRFYDGMGVAISAQRVFGVDAKTGRSTWSRSIKDLR